MPAANRAGTPMLLRITMPNTIAINIASIGCFAGEPIENGTNGAVYSWYETIAIASESSRP